MIAVAIASAVEEQGAATAEIARNVEHTAQSTRAVNANISSIRQATNATGSDAGQVLRAATDLSGRAERLSCEIKAFVGSVRAA